MAIDAEVTIQPETDPAALEAMLKDLSDGLERVAEDTSKVLENQIAKGVGDGAKKGAKSFKEQLRGVGGRAFKGAKWGSMTLIGLATMGITQSIQRANETTALIEGLLGESQADQSMQAAKAAGLTVNQYGQFVAQAQGVGFTDPTAINDLLADIQIGVQDSLDAGGGGLSQFARFSGQERINRLIASVAHSDPEKMAVALDARGITGEDQRALMAIGEKYKGQTYEATLKNLKDANRSEGEKIASNLERESQLAQEYRKKAIEFQNDYKTKILDNIDSGKMDTLFANREAEAKQQLTMLEQFQENSKLAREAQGVMQEVANGIQKATQETAAAVKGIAEFLGIEKISDVKRIAEEQTNELTKGKPINSFAKHTGNSSLVGMSATPTVMTGSRVKVRAR